MIQDSELRVWSDTVIGEPLPTLELSLIDDPLFTTYDSREALRVGLEVGEMDTIPSELLEFFSWNDTSVSLPKA